MRVKDLWRIIPLPATIKLVWDRFTLTKTTSVYFVFSILHCVAQVVLQVHAFQFNAQAAGFLASIIKQGDPVDPDSFYIFENDLRLCNFAMPRSNSLSCQVLWDATVRNTTSIQSPTSTSSCNSISTSIPTAIENAQSLDQEPCNNGTVVKLMFPDNIETVQSNASVQVVLDSPAHNQEGVILDRACLLVLGWPVQILQNTKREDLVFIVFQIWVLGMSIVAILNESIPHMMATLLTHLAATGWTGFQIYSTIRFRTDFTAVTTNGACPSVNLLPAYWQSRANDELSSLILNAVALLVSALLCWKLLKSFGWQTFKRIGASPAISRIYKIVLTLSIVIQLSSFFILTSISLWLDQLWNGAIGHLATGKMYRPCFTVTLILFPLWLLFGWYSVRREHKTMNTAFLVMCCGYLAGWGAMFDSHTFYCTYITWPFFAAIMTASALLALIAFILGVICRINFGKGLPYYLKGHEPIEEGFEAVDPEKVVFSSSRDSAYVVPSFSGMQFPPLPQVSTQNAVQPTQMNIQVSLRQPSRAVTRTPSERTCHSVHRESSHSFVSSSKT